MGQLDDVKEAQWSFWEATVKPGIFPRPMRTVALALSCRVEASYVTITSIASIGDQEF
jgi:hypothetical protein